MMPKYLCHKEVGALKIKAIIINSQNGCGILTPEEDGHAPFDVSAEYMAKHEPAVGGYYVLYEDGYKSFSPASAFEAGYSLMKMAPDV